PKRSDFTHEAAAVGLGAGLWRRGGVFTGVRQSTAQEDRKEPFQSKISHHRALGRLSCPFARVKTGPFRCSISTKMSLTLSSRLSESSSCCILRSATLTTSR